MAIWEGATWAWTASSPSKETTGIRVQARLPQHTSSRRGGGAQPSGLLDLSSVTFDEIARYDGTVFPLPVRAFSAVGLTAARQPLESRQAGLEGYGVLRACRRGFKIGPLFADDPHIAAHYFKAWPPVFPVSLSSSIPRANPRHRTDETAWHEPGSRLHACIQGIPR